LAINPGRMARAARIESRTGLQQPKRVAVLVQHMGRDTVGRALVVPAERLDFEAIRVDAQQDARPQHRGDGTLHATFPGLACVPRRAPRRAFPDGVAADDGGIGRAASQYDIGACVQRSEKGLHAECRDNVLTTVHRLIVQLGMRWERLDTTLRIQSFNCLLVLLAINERNLWRHAQLPSDFHGNIPRPIQIEIAARLPRGPHNNRYTGLRLRLH